MKSHKSVHIETLENILQWSENRPEWLRDALRRLVEKTQLDGNDIKELTELCRQKHAIKNRLGSSFTSIPLSKNDLPELSDSKAVSLLSIKDVKHANALMGDCELSFGSAGLTVLYGDNASGKSGYARILKRACRARANGGKILPDVYGASPQGPASATITFSVGTKLREVIWEDGVPADAELSEISVFDSACGNIQVRNPNNVAFVPFGLDLLERLANTCQSVQEKLKAEISLLENLKPHFIRKAPLRPHTKAGKALNQLTHDTDINTLKAIATLSNEENKRLKQLRADLAQDPEKLQKRVCDEEECLSELIRKVEQIASVLPQDVFEAIKRCINDWATKAEAAKFAASKAFTGEPLSGVGTEVWRTLWGAAQKYSQVQAYPGESFPVTNKGSRCVLCQQPLGEEGIARFHRFEQFVMDTTQRDATEARRHVDERAIRLQELSIPDSKSVLFGIEPDDESQAQLIRAFFESARLRREALMQLCHGKEIGTVPSLTTSPKMVLEELRNARNKRSAELQAASQVSQRAKLIEELDELEDRFQLASLLEDIEKEIERLQQIRAIKASLEDTDTKPITNEAGRLAGQVLTTQLRDRFAAELQKLSIRTARVELVHAGGRYGIQKYQIRLLANPGVPVAAVLSEGEHTCIALAGFLAELTVAGHKSAIVFDDPVTSLGHRWRRFVSDRLVDEAGERQVIVFTHDPVFLMALMENADRRAFPLKVTHLRSGNGKYGIPISGPPWIAMSVKKRIGYLNDRLQEAEAYSNKGQVSAYETHARDIYGCLREAWERAVEEILLNQVVLRFGRSIQTNRLKPLIDITEPDLEIIKQAMSKCSTYFRGHDEAPEINDNVPEPSEIRNDIKQLKDWVDSMRKRRK